MFQVSQLTMEAFNPFGECLEENEGMEWLQNLPTGLVGRGRIIDNRQRQQYEHTKLNLDCTPSQLTSGFVAQLT